MAKAQPFSATVEELDIAQKMLDDKATKKSVCEFLGIAYNTKRLGTILEDHSKSKLRDKEIRRQKRLEACTPEELAQIAEEYLDGASLAELSENFYRSPAYIKNRLEMLGALIRDNGARNPLNAPIFPDEGLVLDGEFRPRVERKFTTKTRKEWEGVIESLKTDADWGSTREVVGSGSKFAMHQKLRQDGELVWVPGYQCLGEIIKEVPSKEDKAYRVLLLDPALQKNVHLPYWDICSLRHLVDAGINVKKLGSNLANDEVTALLNEALKAAKKSK